MNYRLMNEEDMEDVVNKYVDYYNSEEDCCWTYEKAYKRIHQVLTIEGSLCLVQTDEKNEITGFIMGYYKEFDDITGYYLEEIVIFSGNQNKQYGTDFLKELEERLKSSNVSYMELSSVNDEHHRHFYLKSGFYEANNFVLMGKFLS